MPTSNEATPSSLEAGLEYKHLGQHDKPATEAHQKTDMVDWDGPDDPKNPYNWSKAKRMIHVIIVSLFSLNANLAATMFAPAADQLTTDFHFTDPTILVFTVSIYLLGFCVGPLFLAPLSELYGRLVIYHACNIAYVAMTFGCAFSTNVTMFLVFRVFAGIAGSGPISIGGGTVADVTPQKTRGRAISLFGVGPLLGPVLGPIIGGFVTETIGWRWTFRIILILSGVLAAMTLIFMRETNEKVLLQRKAQRLIKETGNEKFFAKGSTQATASQTLRKGLVRPAKMLIFSPVVLLLSLYAGIVFGVLFLLFATFPIVFEETYGFSPGVAGLAYLGLGLGLLSGLLLFALLSDKLLGQTPGSTVARPEERLILMKWFAPIAPLGCFIYGWTAGYHVHWIVPIVGTYFVGVGSLFVAIATQTYLVDAFGPEAAASALAANLIIRTPFGALLVLAAPQLYAKLGLGWGNSVLGFITLAFAPVPWLFYRYGECMRTRFVVDL
ncbi:major facilitator superfamily domain-containing protein [Xylaria sp. CBS 124048]|nr:major facilitator superfamily domain-containing protein [Xylaria sp. CBS 124048]